MVIPQILPYDLNTCFLGWADETISSRIFRYSMKGIHPFPVVHAIVDKLFFWEFNHCYQAYESERLQLPPELRTSS